MEIGMAPFKSLLQTGFMMWMSGNSINIFSIMITAMIVMNTTKSLLNLNSGTFVCSCDARECCRSIEE